MEHHSSCKESFTFFFLSMSTGVSAGRVEQKNTGCAGDQLKNLPDATSQPDTQIKHIQRCSIWCCSYWRMILMLNFMR